MAHWGVALTHWGNPFGGLRTRADDRHRQGGDREGADHRHADAGARRATSTPWPALFASDDVDDAARPRRRLRADDGPGRRRTTPATPRRGSSGRWPSPRPRRPTDKTYAANLRAAEHPRAACSRRCRAHPGLAHYIIHAYDAPPLAPRGLDAARRYAVDRAGRAARAPHAVAHLHPRRLLEGIGRHQPQVGRGGAQGRRPRRRRRGTARARLSDLRLSAAGRRRRRAGRARPCRDVRGRAPSAAPTRSRSPPFRPATRSNARPGPRPPRSRARPAPTRAVHRGDHALRAGHRCGAVRVRPTRPPPDIERLAAIKALLVAAKDPYWAEQVDIQRRVAEAWQVFARATRPRASSCCARRPMPRT